MDDLRSFAAQDRSHFAVGGSAPDRPQPQVQLAQLPHRVVVCGIAHDVVAMRCQQLQLGREDLILAARVSVAVVDEQELHARFLSPPPGA